ncbi:hypothetical protein FGIG_08704 [Fasciola gigantica]|uniref:Uncharacterized protein n=1 Tax=Fasciola gigantica TaxID=46835 RepID=A0A504YXJ4_FASGI|nr:hypothetical protein FGIG_08704 [Fasciola gigantica]
MQSNLNMAYLAKSIDTQFPLIHIDQSPGEGWRSLFAEMQLMLDVTKTTVVEPSDLLGRVTAISEEYTPSVKLADFEIKAPTVPDPTKHLFSKCDGIKSVYLDQKPNESSRETEEDVEMMEESNADVDATGSPEGTGEHVERTENDGETGSRVTDLPTVASNIDGTHTQGDIRLNVTEKASDEDTSPMIDGGDGNYDKTGGNEKKSEIPSQVASPVTDSVQPGITRVSSKTFYVANIKFYEKIGKINSTDQCKSTTEESESKIKPKEETDTEDIDSTDKAYLTPAKFPAQEITEGERNDPEDNNRNGGHMTMEDSIDGPNMREFSQMKLRGDLFWFAIRISLYMRNTTENGKRGIQETLGDVNGKRDDGLVA